MSLDNAARDLLIEMLPELVAEIVAAEVQRIERSTDGTKDLPEVMTTSTLAEHLNCTRQHVNALINTGALRAKSDGNRRLILREWVIDYMRSDRSAPAMARADRERLRSRRINPASAAGSHSHEEGQSLVTATGQSL